MGLNNHGLELFKYKHLNHSMIEAFILLLLSNKRFATNKRLEDYLIKEHSLKLINAKLKLKNISKYVNKYKNIYVYI